MKINGCNNEGAQRAMNVTLWRHLIFLGMEFVSPLSLDVLQLNRKEDLSNKK